MIRLARIFIVSIFLSVYLILMRTKPHSSILLFMIILKILMILIDFKSIDFSKIRRFILSLTSVSTWRRSQFSSKYILLLSCYATFEHLSNFFEYGDIRYLFYLAILLFDLIVMNLPVKEKITIGKHDLE